MKKKAIILILLMITAGIAGGFLISVLNRGNGREAGNADARLKLVTSFYPTYIMALNITDQIPELKVDSLTDFTAGCLHDYQLTTGDMKLLSDADLFLMNGGGMESYLEDVTKNYPELAMVNISEGIDMRESGEHEGEVNSHVWLDPARYIIQVNHMRDGLIQYITERSDLPQEYREDTVQRITDNAEEYISKVKELEEELKRLIPKIQTEMVQHKVIIFHEAFAYLADRVGLTIARTVEMEDESALSAAEVADIISTVKSEGIGYLFTEEQYGASITDRIVEETSAKAYVIDSAVTGDGTKDSYLEAMRKNMRTLEEAFR